MVGPRMASVALCLGCFAPLSPEQLNVCSCCNIATMCGSECESAPGHAGNECALYKKIAAKNKEFDLLDNLQVESDKKKS